MHTMDGRNAGQMATFTSINWKAMNLVSVPEEFKEEVAVNTNDVSVLPRAASGIARNVRRGIKDLTEKMSFGN